MTKVAAIQLCSTENLDENLAMVAELVQEAATNHAQLIVLPEMFPMMGITEKDKVSLQEEYGSGKIQDFLADLAKKTTCWIVGGTIPLRCTEKTKVRASCLVYDATGSVRARYDKIHLFDVQLSAAEIYQESATTQPGDQPVVLATPFGKLGLAVCYDLRFPILFNQLFNQGVEILAVPTAFTAKTGAAHWNILTRARALDTFAYLIGACQFGLHANGRRTYGHSLVIDPWGRVISELSDSMPGVIYATIDLEYLHKVRASIPTYLHQPTSSKR